MKRNFQRIVCFVIVILLGLSIIPGIHAISTSKSIDVNKKTNNNVFYSDNIRISIQDNEDFITIQYKLDDFSMQDIAIEGEIFKQINLDDESNSMSKGKPDLPNICRSIIIPDNEKMDIKVISSKFEEYEGIKIVPSKGQIKRLQNPEEVPYSFDGVYNENRWFPEQVAGLNEPYILRDFRGQVVIINPFQYNPIQEKLRFYTYITVELYPNGIDTINCFSRTKSLSAIDTDFKTIYEKHFLNFETTSYTPVEEQGNMLVVTYDDFWDTMLPFVQWKNLKGINTKMIKVSEIGDADAIKNYITNYYNDKGLTFVLLVGDIQQMPTLYKSSSATDPSFSFVAGTDHYSDLFVGRFSAQTIDQLETQVKRSIEYEKNPQETGDWYHKGTGIASNQGPGDDDEYDDEHIDNIREDLLNYTYTVVDQIYDPSGTTSQVTNALNEGRSVVNYCGHGWPMGWGSTGFSTSNVNTLSNSNMLPFIWSVACNNGEFEHYDTCFAEAWMRSTHNGEPSGAIAVFMSSISQSWSPPMDAQDECVDLLVDSYENNKKYTFGGISFSGCMHMNDEYGFMAYGETDAWHVFGDPSIQVRTDTPTSMIVTHDSSIDMGSLTLEVDVSGVEDALCAVSWNYEVIGYGFTDETGHVVIEFDSPAPYGGVVDLVVTDNNKIPYMGTIPIMGEDEAPNTPRRPSGRIFGKINETHDFSTKSVDPDDDPVFYMWDWGDGTFSDWMGPSDSGETITKNHTWSERGIYYVKVKARDLYRAESDWSESFRVIIPKDKPFSMFSLGILERFFPRFFSFLDNLS